MGETERVFGMGETEQVFGMGETERVSDMSSERLTNTRTHTQSLTQTQRVRGPETEDLWQATVSG